MGNLAFNDFKQDAEKALDILVHQPEVDANHITLVGHRRHKDMNKSNDNPGKLIILS